MAPGQSADFTLSGYATIPAGAPITLEVTATWEAAQDLQVTDFEPPSGEANGTEAFTGELVSEPSTHLAAIAY